jgi:tRNA (mo5U34)-methyltransferase
MRNGLNGALAAAQVAAVRIEGRSGHLGHGSAVGVQDQTAAHAERLERTIRAAMASHPSWYHRIELAPGIVTPGINDCERVLQLLDLPMDLRGKRVLDIGTRDGFFAFVCERRGADVVAVDYMPAEATGFPIAAKFLGSLVPYVCENIYNLNSRELGKFDIVLMLGLLYHLRDPLGALDIVRDLCEDSLYLETHVCDDSLQLADGSVVPLSAIDKRLEQIPLAQFCQGTSLNADPSNFWAPNTACVASLLTEAAFRVEATTRLGNRSLFRARITDDPAAMYQRDIARGTAVPRL